MLGSDVNDDVANQICAQLLFLEGEDPKADVWLYINSPGGSVTAGMAIYDTMQFISCDVATVCLGLAASMGQFLLTAGTAGKRYTLPNAPFAQDGGPDAQSNIFLRLLKSRVIMLGSDVNDDVANQICAQLLFLEGEDPKADVWLYINSPGGSVTAGMAIYDTMQFISCDVATVCLGLAASMGQFLLTAGTAGKRYTLPNARIMMHQPLAGLRGQASDIAIQAEQLQYTKKRMAELIAFHSGQKIEQIQQDSERDRWFTPDQAKEYGLVDKVIVKRGEIR